ncbi:hypothetical protein Aple_097780 [Acrocarpospora pleiomorpha]|uniref:Uncharacterized protein n=1 Tax=Acrocarpospora pleiomorpha TaxID=90975 RepID=A0A5M3Y3G9_9ACTN|nr:hypothetical protein Aple_097780 [Acrocarpospora pleiomorpha]
MAVYGASGSIVNGFLSQKEAQEVGRSACRVRAGEDACDGYAREFKGGLEVSEGGGRAHDGQRGEDGGDDQATKHGRSEEGDYCE